MRHRSRCLRLGALTRKASVQEAVRHEVIEAPDHDPKLETLCPEAANVHTDLDVVDCDDVMLQEQSGKAQPTQGRAGIQHRPGTSSLSARAAWSRPRCSPDDLFPTRDTALLEHGKAAAMLPRAAWTDQQSAQQPLWAASSSRFPTKRHVQVTQSIVLFDVLLCIDDARTRVRVGQRYLALAPTAGDWRHQDRSYAPHLSHSLVSQVTCASTPRSDSQRVQLGHTHIVIHLSPGARPSPALEPSPVRHFTQTVPLDEGNCAGRTVAGPVPAMSLVRDCDGMLEGLWEGGCAGS